MRLGVFVLALIATPLHAQDPATGEDHFLSMCAGCHGEDAQGGGPTAALLTVQPTDLTQLARLNGGDFPLERVVRRIDGTIDVTAHGGAMPVFGLLLTGPSAVIAAPDGTEIVAPEALVDIAAWLETIQEESR